MAVGDREGRETARADVALDERVHRHVFGERHRLGGHGVSDANLTNWPLRFRSGDHLLVLLAGRDGDEPTDQRQPDSTQGAPAGQELQSAHDDDAVSGDSPDSGGNCSRPQAVRPAAPQKAAKDPAAIQRERREQVEDR